VSGWPIGFGNDKKARVFLEIGLAENPDDVDANFLMADFLNEEGELEAAQSYLELAAAAPAWPDRETAYRVSQREIAAMLKTINEQLAKR
jgi:thioredoxin-like negative regulator of GroEL